MGSHQDKRSSPRALSKGKSGRYSLSVPSTQRGGTDSNDHLNKEKKSSQEGYCFRDQIHHENQTQDTSMLVGRRLQSRVRVENWGEGASSTHSRDYEWKENHQAEEDARKDKKHFYSKKQMVQSDRQVFACHVRRCW